MTQIGNPQILRKYASHQITVILCNIPTGFTQKIVTTAELQGPVVYHDVAIPLDQAAPDDAIHRDTRTPQQRTQGVWNRIWKIGDGPLKRQVLLWTTCRNLTHTSLGLDHSPRVGTAHREDLAPFDFLEPCEGKALLACEHARDVPQGSNTRLKDSRWPPELLRG